LTINAILATIDLNQSIVGIENASVTKIEYRNGKYTIKSVNDMSYVEKGKESIEAK